MADGPVNPKTSEPYGKATKAYADWLASQTKEIVSQKDFGFIVKLQKSVWTHPTASALLDNGASEATVRASYCDVPCQMSIFTLESHPCFFNLKVMANNVSSVRIVVKSIP